MNWKEIEPKTIKLRNDLLEILRNIKKENNAENIPKVSDVFNVSSDLLAKLDYDIVICGEVKKGKSTLINSIIGKDLLPTGVKETTSQVFRITNNDLESFSLVFKDGTVENISKEQLNRYGSQVDADLMGEPIFNNRQLDYIQINTQIEFLPKGVSIVDTPGLGALYKSHELITTRYIQNAAAVVFVFDPETPLVEQERLFLEKVFLVTTYVMFVMTKIDSYDEIHWVTQIARSETLLKKCFEKKCYNIPKIFPLASTTLLDASIQKNKDFKEELVKLSYFPELYFELMKLMYITVGLSRTKFAWSEANKQTTKVIASLDNQIQIINTNSKEDQEKFKLQRASNRHSFDLLWGPSSTKRKNIMQDIQAIHTGVQNRASLLTASSGKIYVKYSNKINSLCTIDGITDFAENGFKKLIEEVSSEWEAIAISAQNDVIQILNSINAEMEEISYNDSFSSSSTIGLVKLTSGEKFQGYKGKYFDAAITSTVGATLLGLAGVAIASFAPVIFLGTLIFGFFSGKKVTIEKEIEKNKLNLKSHLTTIMNEINVQLFHSPLSGDHRSIVQKFTFELSNAVENAISNMYLKQKEQLEVESKKLDGLEKLSSEKKQKQLELINSQRKSWFNISNQITESDELLLTIQNALLTNE